MDGSATRPLVASYRFQLTPSFGFDAVAGLLEPLRSLGVSHVYLSPIAEAVPGSEHGYDVVDHRSVRREFGGEEALVRLLDRAADLDLGVVVDHVPNHVSVARAELNPPWWSLLRHGPGSAAAEWFDVDWELTGGRVVVPKLGEPLEAVVAAGGIGIAANGDGSELHVGGLRFPMAPGTGHLRLRDAIEAQHYRLSWWRDPIRNVRRFFTIDDLVAVRVEHGAVAEAVDTLLRGLVEHSAFAGVRVDHVDGLADPKGYLEGLRNGIGDRWLLVEKILGPGEYLPETWPVDGTTGYEHVTAVEHALLAPEAFEPLDALWREAVARDARLTSSEFEQLEHTARLEVLDGGLRPDLDRLVRTVMRMSGLGDRVARDAVVGLTLALDRYRTYLPDDDRSARVLAEIERSATADRSDIAGAIRTVAALIRDDETVRSRWQQLTGPVMAKGAEDRAFYRHQRLSSLCEVGGRPGTWTLDIAEFHEHQRRMQAGWPTNMLTATTHDTKRSEAVRARSLALAAIADEWVASVRSWWIDHGVVAAELAPGDVLLALQTAVTARPLTVDRLADYLVKAAREAELDTDWLDHDPEYEAGLRRVASALVEETAGSELGGVARRIEAEGSRIGLAVLALQLTCPGVPDLYQGAPSELGSLVDPDNRRPPDWERWAQLADGAPGGELGDLTTDQADLVRTRLVRAVLAHRRRHPEAFGVAAGYVALEASGPSADRVLGFARTEPEGRPVIAVVVLRPGPQGPDPATHVAIPEGSWRNLATGSPIRGGTHAVMSLLGDVGVVVLEIDE